MKVYRAEAVLSAKDRMGPGVNSAARRLQQLQRQTEQSNRAFAMASRGFTAFAGLMVTGAAAGAIRNTVLQFGEIERSMTRIGVTAGATRGQVDAATKGIRDIAFEVALPFENVKGGLDALVASGENLGDAMRMLPVVARTAQASGSAVEDIAKSSQAVIRNLGVSIEDLQRAQDMMAAGGKLGQFETKDMAQFLPSLAPAARAVGMEGTKGLAKLIAMLQIVRTGTGEAGEAATAVQNVFTKMESNETAKKFKQAGVDLRKEMKQARRDGRDLMETFLDLSERALGGDLSKVPQLFTDQEFQKAMRPLLRMRKELRDMEGAVGRANGVVARDLEKVLADQKGSYDKLAESAGRAATALGGLLGLAAAPGAEALANILERSAASAERIKAAVEGYGVLRTLMGDTPEAQAERKKSDERQRKKLEKGEIPQGMVTIIDLTGGFGPQSKDLIENARNKATLEERRSRLKQTIRERDEQKANEWGTMVGHAEARSAPVIDAMQSDIRRLEGKIMAFELRDQLRRMSGLMPPPVDPTRFGATPEYRAPISPLPEYRNVPLPPPRPGAGLPQNIDVGALDEARPKIADVISALDGIGPAASAAGGALASSFNGGLAAMQASFSVAIAAMQAQLNSLKPPTLRVPVVLQQGAVGGRGGPVPQGARTLPTGRSDAGVR